MSFADEFRDDDNETNLRSSRSHEWELARGPTPHPNSEVQPSALVNSSQATVSKVSLEGVRKYGEVSHRFATQAYGGSGQSGVFSRIFN